MRKDIESIQEAMWSAMPKWVKRLTVLFGLPAWLIIVYGLFTENVSQANLNFACVIFAIVVIIQLPFLFRALWNNEI